MIVGEMVAAEVVKECHPLGGREDGQRWRLLIDVGEDLFGAAECAAVEEELQADVCHKVDSDAAAFGFAVRVNA